MVKLSTQGSNKGFKPSFIFTELIYFVKNCYNVCFCNNLLLFSAIIIIIIQLKSAMLRKRDYI
jgi:hypothetical protein